MKILTDFGKNKINQNKNMKENPKTLEKFLIKNNARNEFFKFADLTLKQFLKTCGRSDRILWLFVRTNPNHLKEFALAISHCVNRVRHLMKDERSTKAVDVTIAYLKGKATKEELENAAYGAWAAANAPYGASYAAIAAYYVACACENNRNQDDYGYWRAYRHAYWASSEEIEKEMADICRKYLPLEIWDQSKL